MSNNATASATLKTFRATAWDGKRGDFTCAPFRRSETNPDASKFAECPSSDMKNATRLWLEGPVEVWGWL